jgi:hypothetical protein
VSEQIVDLKSMSAILRRRVGTLAVAVALGALAGGAVGYRVPPSYASTSIVLLPPAPQTTGTVGTHTIDTQVQIATSEAVLGPAGRAVTPHLTPVDVGARVEVVAPTTDVLSITATGPTAAAAEALSAAVAKAEVDYLHAAASSLGQAALAALTAREGTLKESLAAVNSQIAQAQSRLAHESPSSPQGKADAAALGELTAQQAKTVLQIDEIDKQASSVQPVPGDSGGDASVIQQASPGTRRPPALQSALFAAGGAGVLFVLCALALILRGRREAALRSRDQIADAVGIPVVASIRSRAPHSVAGWTSLLESYAPDNVERWTLRQLLRLVTPGTSVSLAGEQADPARGATVLVVSLAGDLPALAVGPQFASLAASTGTTTQLITAQHHESANALWAACASLPPESQPRAALWVDARLDAHPSAQLVIHVAVVDRERAELQVPGVDRAVTLLAVSSGVATPEELARVALAADEAGHAIDRIVIVDPDPLDRTTGRLLPTERAQHIPLPSLMTGSPSSGGAILMESHRRMP